MYKQWVCQLDDAKSWAEKQIQLKKITQKVELAYIYELTRHHKSTCGLTSQQK
jgi:hypothetical protein